MNVKENLPLFAMFVMMIAVQLGALLITPTINEAGYAAFEDPGAVENILYFIIILLVFTAIMLLLIRHGFKRILGYIIGVSIFLVFLYIYSAIALLLTESELLAAVFVLLLSAGSMALLYKYPEWYVIDILGILICAGTASIFGISLEVFPAIVLLVILAAYDAISVYKTKHMISLAEGVINTKSPILVVIPKSRNYSYIKDDLNIGEGKEERGAFIMGMGDLIMPTIIVVSSYVFISTPDNPISILPTIAAMIGSLAGLCVLLWYVVKGRPQAGLPTLNGGAIIGFLIGCTLAGTWGWIPFL
ncbi:presenilin family intramembrane aspartyl protease PSH [Methanolacinia paynteri]|uniref:presenilin family intramembrane aspartyl protease PSH n=1 Tax=Methanolacinia paynteri TaxID=230356 RepID=UPI00064FAF37|nr:presenilin family intramembrane aspartyl protease PSH [Methanolacinia paynteri]